MTGFSKLATSGLGALSLVTTSSCAPDNPAPPAAAAPAAPKLMTWNELRARPQAIADKSFTYGADPYQVVDLWRPTGPGPHPVVLMVHGGCWTTSIADRTLMNWAAADLRGRGIAVWNIDYRGVDRPGGAPDGIFRDVAAAADLLRTHAAAERLDLGRVVAVGHSAGGHLALWLAARPRVMSEALKGGETPLPIMHVVSLGGLPDLAQAFVEPQGCGKEPIEKLVAPAGRAATVDADKSLQDRTKDEDELVAFLKRFGDRSLPPLAPIGVPQTLINGDADRIIPTHFATDYAAKMRAAGDAVTVRIVPDQGHVELISPGTPAWSATTVAIERVLRR